MEIDFSTIATSLLSAGGLLAFLEIVRFVHGARTGRNKEIREKILSDEDRLSKARKELDDERTKRLLWQEACVEARNVARKFGATDEDLGDIPGSGS